MKKAVFFSISLLLLIFFIFRPNQAQALGENCNPWTGDPCEPSERCTRTGLGSYECRLPKQSGELCSAPPLLNECDSGLSCVQTAIAEYRCFKFPQGCIHYIMPNECSGHNSFRCPGTPFCCPDENYCSQTPAPPFDPCKNDETGNCLECQKTEGSVWTALGCIPVVDNHELIAWILARAIGVGGGIALLIIIIGAIQVITSSGDPDKVKNGKDMITSAVIGLILIIFSIFLLDFIGVKIFQIPGLS